MKVFHVITGLGQGGAEVVLYRLVSGSQDSASHCVISLTNEGVFGERLRQCGAKVVCLGMSGAFGTLAGIARLVRLLRRGRPDVVQTWMYHGDLLGGLAAKILGIPVVWGVHNTNLEKNYTKRVTRGVVGILSVIAKFVPSSIVSCSDTARDAHQALGYPKELFRIIPNGLDVSEYRPDHVDRESFRREIGVVAADLVFCNVARFHPQKDHRNLISAFLKAFADQDRVHLVMCGEGLVQDNSDLVRYFRAGVVPDRVHLLGARNDIPRVLAGADYFVLSSLGEAFPCVVVEAMAAGVPCVVTDAGDSAAIVGNTGWVVPPIDSDLLASAMSAAAELAVEDREERARGARTRIMENFHIQKMVSSYLEVWAAACGRRGS